MKGYDIGLEILLEAAHGSARRIRTILIIMVIASVLAFSAFWNSLGCRWSIKRIRSISKVSYNLERLQSDFKDSLIKELKKEGNLNPLPLLPPAAKTLFVKSVKRVLYYQKLFIRGILGGQIFFVPLCVPLWLEFDGAFRGNSSPNQNSGKKKTLESLTIQDFKKDNGLKESFLLPDFIKKQQLDEPRKKEMIKEISFRRFEIEKMPDKKDGKDKEDGKKEEVHILKFDIFIGEEKVETLRVALKEHDLKLIETYLRLFISGTKELRNAYLKSTENQELHFNIPFFNINFDMNDLGFIGGLAFFLILGTLYLNLNKEKENIGIAFETSKTVFKTDYVLRRDFIKFMSLNQLFSITSEGQKRIKTIARSVFLWMPAFVSLLILFSDFCTYEIGEMLDPDGYFFYGTMVGRVVFFLINLGLTYLCYKKTKDIDAIWKTEMDEVNELKKSKSRRRKRGQTRSAPPLKN
jgi:hypothetical protein